MNRDQLIDAQNSGTYPFDEPQEGDEGFKQKEIDQHYKEQGLRQLS